MPKSTHHISNNHSDTDIAISIQQVSKSFKLPHNKQSSIKSAFVNFVGRGDRSYEIQEVLRGVTFDIQKGDFFGIVGRNGSGKSTLLKMISGIYMPTKGKIMTNGSLTPFIELGVGFNPELTGRENVYLNGALLGFNEKEVGAMYDDIVRFAELERFMDQKLKNYSSGMQVRLAFSIAIQAKSDILVLDEVLAVGDEAFQKKCFQYFDQLKREKKTVVLVTHDMAAVERFCNKAVLIEDGKVVLEGKPHKVAAAYSRSNDVHYDASKVAHQQYREGFEVSLQDMSGAAKNSFAYDETMLVRLGWSEDGVKNIGVAIFRDNGEYVFGPNTYQDKYTAIEGSHQATYAVKLNLNEGDYFIKIGLMGNKDVDMKYFVEEGPHFTVKRDYEHGRWGGVTKLPYEWQVTVQK